MRFGLWHYVRLPEKGVERVVCGGWWHSEVAAHPQMRILSLLRTQEYGYVECPKNGTSRPMEDSASVVRIERFTATFPWECGSFGILKIRWSSIVWLGEFKIINRNWRKGCGCALLSSFDVGVLRRQCMRKRYPRRCMENLSLDCLKPGA
jgi:hypothetical protein